MCIKLNSMKLVGIERKTGDYQGRPYDNRFIHFLEEDNSVIGGMKTSLVKFKTKELRDLYPDEDLPKLIGKEVKQVIYDKYGNASGFVFK